MNRRWPMILGAWVLLAGTAQAEDILAFTTDARPFTGDRHGVRTFNLDDVPRLEAQLSQGLAGDPQRAKVQILARINTAEGSALLRALPDTGLEALNQDGDSIEVALAKQLVA